jgi:hypothetical protein
MNLTGAIISIKINGHALDARVVDQEGTSFIVDIPTENTPYGKQEAGKRFFLTLNFFQIVEMPKVPDSEARGH